MKITGKSVAANRKFDIEISDERITQYPNSNYFLNVTIDVGTGVLKALVHIPRSELEALLWKAIDSKLRA